MQLPQVGLLILIAAGMFLILGGISLFAHIYTLNIKAKTVGNGQHGTAQWASKREIRQTYAHVPFEPEKWRRGVDLPTEQGIIVGCETHKGKTVALVDTGDVHAVMIGAAGVGKTAYWLYPCIEYALASGMSFLSTDTKGDIARNYGGITSEKYGYHVAVIDLRNPTRSDGFNLLHLVNKYMDLLADDPSQLMYRAKAEKYAKIIAKTIIMSGTEGASFGQNAYFYDAAEGILTASILLVAEFCPEEERHIVSVFKIIQELLAPSKRKERPNFSFVGRIRRAFEKPGIYVENITPEMLEKFYRGIMKEGCVANTVIHYIAVLKQALQYAVKQGLIPSNPCDRVDCPKKNKFHGEHYSSKEVMTLLALVQDDPIYIPVLLASYYGLRRSEALGLRWSRVDFQRKQIHIDCKVYEQRVDGKFIAVPSEEMKNESSRRTLPLIPEVEKALLRQRKKQSLYRKLHGKSYTTEFLDFVCVDPFGKLMRPNFITEHFDWFLRQNGMRKIRFHDLRHTCASLLIANGVDLKSIQEWLGHSTFSTTADIYAHLDYTSKENSAGVMSKILGGGDEPEDSEGNREEQDFSMSM